MRFNSDSGSNYTRVYSINNNKGSYVKDSGISQDRAYCGYVPRSQAAQASVFGFNIIEIQDYTLANKYKTWKAMQCVDIGNNSTGGIGYQGGAWQNTAAITSITFLPESTAGNFAANSVFALYGIKG
jgi:hypothetical protein